MFNGAGDQSHAPGPKRMLPAGQEAPVGAEKPQVQLASAVAHGGGEHVSPGTGSADRGSLGECHDSDVVTFGEIGEVGHAAWVKVAPGLVTQQLRHRM